MKASLKKLIFWLFLVLFVWIAATRFGQTKHILQVLSSGKWYFIGLAVVCQLFYYPFYAYFVEFIFSIFGLKFSRGKVLSTYIASKFTDVALPLATFGQVAVFVRNGKKEKLPPIDVGFGIIFVLLLQIMSFLIIAILATLTFYFFGTTRAYLTIPLLILSVVILMAIWLILRLAVYQKVPNKAVLWIMKWMARLAGQKNLVLEDIGKIFLEVGKDIRRASHKIWRALELSVATHLINLITLGFVYLAFVGSFNPLAVLGGYVACLLFTIVSITPQGVGVAEGVMIATFHSFGLDLSTSAVVTLAFRGLLYWLPLFAGFYVFSKMEFENNKIKDAK